MLTADGCRQRRQRFWQRLGRQFEGDHVRLADPLHLIYLANFHVEPISLNAGFGGALLLRRDGHARLLHDDRLKAHADRRGESLGKHVEHLLDLADREDRFDALRGC